MNNTNLENTQRQTWSSIFMTKRTGEQCADDKTQLLAQAGEPDGSGAFSNEPLERPLTRRLDIRQFALIQLGLIFLYTLLFVTITHYAVNSTRSSQLIYSPAEGVGKIEAKLLHNHLFEENPFKGAAGPVVDDAWNKLFTNAYIRLSPQEMQRLGRQSTPIHDGSGDFLGSLDMYHQLHCVKYIYEYVHPEYYQVNDTNVSVIDHVDHCIDMLRQVSMCRAETAVLTFSYIPNHPLAWPDFNMVHECRDWDAVDAWAGSRSVDQTDLKHFRDLTKNPGYVGGVFDGHDPR